MTKREREEWPKAKEASRMLVRQLDAVVKQELPGAVKKYGYWRAGSIAGEAGGSLFVGRDGKWKDGNPSSDARGDLIDLIAQSRGVSLSDAYVITCVEYLGYEKQSDGNDVDRKPAPRVLAPIEAPKIASLEPARRIWRETLLSSGTPVERYLRDARGITCPIPSVIRYHPQCPRGEHERLPAMIALYTDIRTNEPRAIHRTFLLPDGSGKDGGDDAKMALGPNGGCCIKLTRDEDVTLGLGICEGIETGLSLLSIGCGSIWAAGTAGTIKSFPVLGGIEFLSVYADHDAPSERTGKRAGLDAAEACARRWVDAGREARIIYPSAERTDWNDVARAA